MAFWKPFVVALHMRSLMRLKNILRANDINMFDIYLPEPTPSLVRFAVSIVALFKVH